MNDLSSSGPLEGQIRAIEKKVETLRSGLAAVNKPWYRDGTTVIASLAFVFSLSTTVFSYLQSQQARYHDLRVELRSLIQRQIDLEKELVTIPLTYNDLAVQGYLRGYVAKDQELITRQAYELIQALPQNQVTAIEYMAISKGFSEMGLLEEALILAQDAIRVSHDGQALSVSRQRYAELLFKTGDYAAGREQYQLALDAFEHYQSIPLYEQRYSQLYTERSWIVSEYTNHQCTEAKQHVDAAQALISELQDSIDVTTEQLNVDNWRQLLSTCTGKQ